MKIVVNKATVLKVLESSDKIQKLEVLNSDGVVSKAIAYMDIVNVVSEGNTVLSNRIAAKLTLGTGGYDFIISNLSDPELERDKGPGHIIKMPYSPFQSAVLSVEEKDSPYHDLFKQHRSIENMPVIVCGLHSHIVPAVAMLKYKRPGTKVTCVITDGAALPVALSDSLRRLRSDLIENIISCGNAYGGDLEAVNIYTALLAAKHVNKSDIAIVAMGPGIKGTETIYGHSGIEQGWIIDAVNTLQGVPVYSPRISFADKRPRHKGISHHSLTVLREIAKTQSRVALPKIVDPDNLNLVKDQLSDNGLFDKHSISFEDTAELAEALASFSLEAHSMGRNIKDDPCFFEAAACAALAALGSMEI